MGSNAAAPRRIAFPPPALQEPRPISIGYCRMSEAGHLRELARRCRREAGHRPTREAVAALNEMAAELERRAAKLPLLALPRPLH